MKKTTCLIAVLLLSMSLALAQEPAPISGTVTFRNEASLTGIIRSADLGIMEGSGLGTNAPGGGSLKLAIGGSPRVIPAASIATVEVTWADASKPNEPVWDITELRVTTRDGQTLVGKPTWHMHATNVSIELPSGETKRVHAFPLAGPDFKPENLIAKIELTGGGAALAPAPTTPTPEPTAPTTPAPEVTTPAPAPTPDLTITPVPVPAPMPHGTPAPAPLPGTPSAPVGVAPLPAAATAVHPIAATPGQPLVVSVQVPGSDKVVNILLYVTVTEQGIAITPAQ